ncbi:MAG: sensor histidine kinase [Thiobacillaceae bacterium]
MQQPHHAESLPSHSAPQNTGLNGNSRHRRQESDGAGVVIDENAILIKELHLLATQLEKLNTANRRKDEFLAILSHELRSPLASIQYGLAVLRGPSGADMPVQQGMHELIERQVGQIAQLASGLLDVGRITSGHLLVERERVDLRGILAKAIETLEPEFSRRRQVVVPTWAASAIWLRADASRLEQVFVNLLANASKYTDAGGRASLSMSAHKGYASVRIKDSGIGIAADALPHIFDLYVQVDATSTRSRSGLGIGLALVQKIVQLHGGTVTAASAGLGRGSEFIVRLPAEV